MGYKSPLASNYDFACLLWWSITLFYTAFFFLLDLSTLVFKIYWVLLPQLHLIGEGGRGLGGGSSLYRLSLQECMLSKGIKALLDNVPKLGK